MLPGGPNIIRSNKPCVGSMPFTRDWKSFLHRQSRMDSLPRTQSSLIRFAKLSSDSAHDRVIERYSPSKVKRCTCSAFVMVRRIRCARTIWAIRHRNHPRNRRRFVPVYPTDSQLLRLHLANHQLLLAPFQLLRHLDRIFPTGGVALIDANLRTLAGHCQGLRHVKKPQYVQERGPVAM